MKRILIAGASTFGVKNAGDDAMFSNLVKGFRRRLADCRLTFLARHLDKGFDDYFGVRSIKNVDHDTKEQSVGRWFWGFNPGDPTDHLREIRNAFEVCDLLVIGGNSFMEISEASFLRGVPSYSALLASWARLFEKPYALSGVAAHPLRGELTKQLARFLCGNAQLVTVREEFTRQQLIDAGVRDDNMHVLADPAFGVDPVWDRSIALELLERENIRLSSAPLVGVCLRHVYWRWGSDDFEHASKRFAELCDFIVKDIGAELLFIPNCTYNVPGTQNQDDRPISEHIRNQMRYGEKAHLIKGDYMFHETLSLFQLLDLEISNRRHSCIFAAIHHVPMIGVSTGLLWHVTPFLDALSLSEQIVDFTNDSMEAMTAKIKETWENRDSIRQTLTEVLPGLRAKAHREVDLLVDMMGDGKGAAEVQSR